MRRTLVDTIGRRNFEIPFMNGERLRLPSGGFVRARYAGWRRSASIQHSHHSAMTSSRAVSCSRAFDGGSGGRTGACRAVSVAMALRRRRRADPLAASGQTMVICRGVSV
jgi:hypothetical protein